MKAPFCAFAGSDIVMDLYAVSGKEGLLIDLGTNGELALSHQGKWFVSSAACGPAFEGGNMACGSPAVNGAIDKVWYDKTWHWHTISSAPAQSVCGSGYISWIAGALDQDLLEESGYLSEEIELLPGIYLARQDIRSFQMAKGALAAAIETLCSYARMRVSEIERIVIAGGFGQHLDPAHLCQLGFFPAGFSGTVECVGNRALQGAARYAILQDHKTIEELIHRSVPVLLAVQSLFMERFAANMQLSSKKRKDRDSFQKKYPLLHRHRYRACKSMLKWRQRQIERFLEHFFNRMHRNDIQLVFDFLRNFMQVGPVVPRNEHFGCLLYTSDAAAI